MPTLGSAALVCTRMALASVLVLAPQYVNAADLAAYRGFTLGASTADVLALSGGVPRDLKTVHARPVPLEELSWRPADRRDVNEPDSVRAIVFSFVDDQLFRMVVDYDRSRTAGLTTADMIASVSGVYGPRSTLQVPVPRKSALESLNALEAVAAWREGDAVIVLNHSPYTGGFGLLITSARLEAIARQAQAAALALDAREAPAREAAREKADAEARRADAEKTRTANKGAFKP